MGLDGNNYTVLTDIQGLNITFGDMDTVTNINQMGYQPQKSWQKPCPAKKARSEILFDVIEATIPEVRPEFQLFEKFDTHRCRSRLSLQVRNDWQDYRWRQALRLITKKEMRSIYSSDQDA